MTDNGLAQPGPAQARAGPAQPSPGPICLCRAWIMFSPFHVFHFSPELGWPSPGPICVCRALAIFFYFSVFFYFLPEFGWPSPAQHRPGQAQPSPAQAPYASAGPWRYFFTLPYFFTPGQKAKKIQISKKHFSYSHGDSLRSPWSSLRDHSDTSRDPSKS